MCSCVFCRSSKPVARSQQRSGELQYAFTGGSAKYDVGDADVVTWKQQQQQHVYDRQHHQPLMMLTGDRDYATTLQMRQASTPLLRAPADGLGVPGAVCSCPLHGHLAAPADDDDLPPPPPPSPGPTAAAPARFSSFRPRVEHIYEVPKFVDAAGAVDVDDDDSGGVGGGAAAVNLSSPLYSELDTTAFGTVGRRTPSTRGSRRQPPLHSSIR